MNVYLYAIVREVDEDVYHIWQAEYDTIKKTLMNINRNRCTDKVAIEHPRTVATFINNFDKPNYESSYNGLKISGFLGFRENVNASLNNKEVWFTQAQARVYSGFMGHKICDSCVRLLYRQTF